MKKYIVPTIVIFLVAVGIFIRYEIMVPARAAARDLEAINGIDVGKTTEAELLGRSAFQTVDRHCIRALCIYHTERVNDLLWRLHLAPFTFLGTAVSVRDGMVAEVAVFINRKGLTPISFDQTASLPVECTSNPCVKPLIPPNKKLASVRIMLNNESDFRNRMPEAMQTACLSRLHGCTTVDELIPLARGLNLDAITALK